jgi:glycosyltransferase involved in cell wall biosynthesis
MYVREYESISGESPMTKIRVLSVVPDIIPSTVLFALKPMLFLKAKNRIEFKLTFSELPKRRYADWADVILFCRNSEQIDLNLLEYAKKTNKKVVYELDDNILNVDPNTPFGRTIVGRHYLDPDRKRRLQDLLTRSDLVRVYSEPLREEAVKYNGNITLSRGYFDFSLIENESRKEHDSKIRITYATSRGKIDYLQPLLTEAICSISDIYRDRVEFYIFGSRFPIKGPAIHFIPFTRDYDGFIRSFYRTGCDIGLAPMEDDLFHRSKTDVKYREYGACRTAGIYSDVSLYRSCIEDGVNGVLVDNSPRGWISAMAGLIDHPALLEKIRDNAYRDIRENYSMSDFCDRLLSDLQHLVSPPTGTHVPRDRPKGMRAENRPTEGERGKRRGFAFAPIAEKARRAKKYALFALFLLVPGFLFSFIRKEATVIWVNYLGR